MITGKVLSLAVACWAGVLLSGCVMNEKYEAEKARALNFQRLLAQEERRTGELDSELKRIKRDTPELEARNRELTAQLQAVREQMARVQEETTALREAAELAAREELQRSLQGKPKTPAKAKSKPVQPILPKSDGMLGGDIGTPLYHEVKPGETLFRLSRQYAVDVGKIREWNGLKDNQIAVGQKLVVGYQ